MNLLSWWIFLVTIACGKKLVVGSIEKNTEYSWQDKEEMRNLEHQLGTCFA